MKDSSLSRTSREVVFLEMKPKCAGCGAEFDTQDKLIDHVVEAHDSKCVFCGAKMNSKIEMVVHNKGKHHI